MNLDRVPSCVEANYLESLRAVAAEFLLEAFGNTLRGIQDWAILPSLDRERLSQQEGIANGFCL